MVRDEATRERPGDEEAARVAGARDGEMEEAREEERLGKRERCDKEMAREEDMVYDRSGFPR